MKGQKPPWNMKSQGSNVTQRSSWISIYVTFSFERRVRTSLLILFVARLMRVDYSRHFLESFEFVKIVWNDLIKKKKIILI